MSISSFFQKLVPKDKKFFPMFDNMADLVTKAAVIMLEVFEHDDPVKQKDQLKEIKDLETKADEVAHFIFDELDKTFVTPFDREDIHKLTSTLDSVLDLMNGISQRVRLYRPQVIPAEFRDLAKINLKGCEYLKEAVGELHNLKKPQKVLKICKKISEMESEADDVYHASISNIFKKEKDAIELIKQKEILETLERTSDRIEDVADVLRTIIIKMA
jgi:predicted phosphate transport protein (TIGR00153 family)